MDAGFVAEDGWVEDWFFDAAAFLVDVVAQRDADAFGQAGDGVEVRQAQEAHEEVSQVPDQRELCDAAEEDHGDNEEAEQRHEALALALEEGDVDFAVVVVAADGAEGEHHDHEGNSNRGKGAEDAGQGCLREGDARDFAADRVLTGQKDDESRSRADEPGIDVDAEGLYKTLLDRMGDIGRSGSVRYRTFTGLIGEQAALDTCEDGRAEAATDGSLRGEGIVENQGEHIRHHADVDDDDSDGRQDVETSHDRYEELGEFRDTRDAAENDKGCEHAEDGGRDDRLDAKGALDRQSNRVGLYRVVDKAEGHGNQDGEELGYARLLERILDVVSRAAVEGVVAPGQLIDLGQRAFDEARGTADEGDDPHPEDGTRTAGNDCDSHTSNVADTDTRRCADAEGLEGADGFAFRLLADPFRQQADHLRQHAQLDKFRREREPKAAADEDGNEHIRPEDVVDLIDNSV